eukprot:896226-Prymnesium_polylepis.1
MGQKGTVRGPCRCAAQHPRDTLESPLPRAGADDLVDRRLVALPLLAHVAEQPQRRLPRAGLVAALERRIVDAGGDRHTTVPQPLEERERRLPRARAAARVERGGVREQCWRRPLLFGLHPLDDVQRRLPRLRAPASGHGRGVRTDAGRGWEQCERCLPRAARPARGDGERAAVLVRLCH